RPCAERVAGTSSPSPLPPRACPLPVRRPNQRPTTGRGASARGCGMSGALAEATAPPSFRTAAPPRWPVPPSSVRHRSCTAGMPAVVDNTLAAGTGTGPAPLLQPGDVARAVVAAVDRPRFEITVPAYIGPLTRMAELLPQAMRDRLFAAMVPDQVAEVRAE